jgi:hypothetical protein
MVVLEEGSLELDAWGFTNQDHDFREVDEDGVGV